MPKARRFGKKKEEEKPAKPAKPARLFLTWKQTPTKEDNDILTSITRLLSSSTDFSSEMLSGTKLRHVVLVPTHQVGRVLELMQPWISIEDKKKQRVQIKLKNCSFGGWIL